MRQLGSADLIAMFHAMAEAIEADKHRLSELDGVIGDGDHGVTMSIGFAAVAAALRAADPATMDPTAVFNLAAKSFLNAVGASAGPLYATAFLRAGAAVKGLTTLDRDAFVAVLAAMLKGMLDRGKAERGDKTMIDAWAPAVEAAQAAQARDADLEGCVTEALTAAQAGAEATKAMIALKGRASRLGERSRDHMDPGAASAVIILRAMKRFCDTRLAS